MTNERAYRPLKAPRQARSRATYDAILEAAAQLLPRHGYAGTTTNRIAERAGVSIGSVYEYFPGKDAIFATLKQRLDRQTFDLVLRQLQDLPSHAPRDLLAAVLEARIEAALRQPKVEALLRSEIPASVVAAQSEDSFNRFAEVMRAFAAAHSDAIRIEDSDAVMNLGVHLVELTVTQFSATQPEQLRDPVVVAALIDLMCRWILKDEPRSAAMEGAPR